MAPTDAMTLIFVSMTLCYLTLTQGQTKGWNKGICNNRFVVPTTDLISKCKSSYSHQVERLRKKLDSLQEEFYNLSGWETNPSHPGNKDTLWCPCDNSSVYNMTYTDCDAVKEAAESVSGIYKIDPIKNTWGLIEFQEANNGSIQKYWVVDTWGAVNVYCDLEDEEVGWTILMRRSNFDVSFDRDWNDYKWGFGNKEDGRDFWLGLENMYRITGQKTYSLWIVVVDDRKVTHIFPYGYFRVDSEATNYTAITGDYHGRGLGTIIPNVPFSTRNYGLAQECARANVGQGGGWWLRYGFSRCGLTRNLNGLRPVVGHFEKLTPKSIVMKVKPFET